ncbi:cation:proton antiporter, partial [Acinetobacter baumannii]
AGLGLALSSTAFVLPILGESGEFSAAHGRSAFAILLFQDLSIIPLITITTALSRNPADAGGPPGWLLALETLGAVL